MRRARTAWLSCGISLAVAAIVGLVVPGAAVAAPPPSQPRTLVTSDGVNLHITYYPSEKGKDAPVVVLLHGKDGNRFIWQSDDGFAEMLQKNNYAVVTVDLRQHGETKGGAAGNANQDKKKPGKKGTGPDLKPDDYRAMVAADMEAVKKFIFEENQAEHLNMNKMGIVGAEMGATVAALYADVDWNKEPYDDAPDPKFATPRGQDVRALVLISPQSSYHGLHMAPAINDLRTPQWGIAVLVCVGKNDAQDKGQSKKIFDQAKAPPGNEKHMYYYDYAGKLRGTDLLGKNLGIEGHMLVFFEEHLKKLDAPWRDRESRLRKKATK
jgi:pimeloyl-ACP methyl ester carboxylesterase